LINEQKGEVGAKDQGLQVSLKKNQEQARAMTERIGMMTNTLHESRNGDKILQSLKEAQRQGKIKGVLGRLGDLGTIEKQYDIAISTACTGLDNILVESASSG